MQPSRTRDPPTHRRCDRAPVAGCVAPGTTGTGGDPTGDAEAGARSTLDVGLVGPDADRALFDAGDVARGAGHHEPGRTAVAPVVVTDQATSAAAETAREVGLADAPDEFEAVVRRDGEPVGRFGVTPGFAEAVADGEWEGEVLPLFERRERAAELRDAPGPAGESGGRAERRATNRAAAGVGAHPASSETRPLVALRSRSRTRSASSTGTRASNVTSSS